MTEQASPYLRIAEHLRALIESGDLGPGDRMPSLTDLAQEFGCTPAPASRAYGLLVDEGMVISRHGAGHYVRSQAPVPLLVRQHRKRSEDSPFASGAAAQGVTGTWQHESTTAVADERTAARLGVDVGAPVMRTSYVYLADGEPVQTAESWEPMAVTGSSMIVLPEAGPYAGIGVAARMRVIGVDVGEPVERVRARGATRAEATALGISPSAPVLAIERTFYDQATGRAVESADIVLRGDRWEAVYGAPPA